LIHRTALGFLAAGALLAAPSLGQEERFVAFGDSITLGVGDDGSGGGYPPRLQQLLNAGGVTAAVENRGVDGETTAEGLARIGGLSGASGDTILIMEGINDVTRNVSIETIRSNLDRMVKRARAVGFGRVVLMPVLPRGRGAKSSERARVLQLADETRQLANDFGIEQPDPFVVFVYHPEYPDGLYMESFHPNGAGYDLLAGTIADSLLGIDNVAPAPAFVRPVVDSIEVSPGALLEVVLFDPISGLDSSASTLTLNGGPLPTQIVGEGRRVVLQAQPGNLVGRPRVGIDVTDLAIPANRRVVDVTQFIVRGTSFLPGDIDRSGRVDGADLVLLGRAFGTRAGDSRYLREADITANGRIDGSDLALLAANFGQSSF
jgi:acyl-CoA thioesterase-1